MILIKIMGVENLNISKTLNKDYECLLLTFFNSIFKLCKRYWKDKQMKNYLFLSLYHFLIGIYFL